MTKDKALKSLIIFNAVSFVLMVAVNAIANILPLNGVTTGAVSDSYPNLFAPAGITFLIWGLIYLLLAVFIIYQLGALKSKKRLRIELIKSIGVYFIISSLANMAWIFAWHYKHISATVIIMVVIFLALAIIYTKINNMELSKRAKVFVRLPFSVYFGWITIALIANITTWLVSVGWSGFGLSPELLTVIVIALGAVISITTILLNKDVAFGLVILWAYLGILIKHISASGFDWQYTGIIIAVIIAMALIISTVIYTFVYKKSQKNTSEKSFDYKSL